MKFDKITKVILTDIYPEVVKLMDKNELKYKKAVERFMNARNAVLFDTCPCDRIYYGDKDRVDMLTAVGIDPKWMKSKLENTYYYNVPKPTFKTCKDEITILLMCIIRYYFEKKNEKMMQLSMIYLSFSGKLYPSLHYGRFRIAPTQYRHVMEYVVNNMLSNKFDLKTEGSVFGAVKKLGITWLNTYEDMLDTFDDEDVVYMILQLHNRIKTFLLNIGKLYYEAYKNKNYMSYDSDSLEQGDYHLADSDSLKAERFIEAAVNKVNGSSIDYRLCKMCADNNVKVEEIKGILESILNNRDYVLQVKELIRNIVYAYFLNSKTKEVSDISFITFTIAPKPNTKEKIIIRNKEIIENWLTDTSVNYRKRKSRQATANSYNRAILLYFTLIIHYANK